MAKAEKIKNKGYLKMKNKKVLIIAIVAVVVIAAVVLGVVLLGGNKEKEYKLGMGVVVSLDSSKTGTAQIDATVATVVLDAEGKIVACRIDVAQNKITLDATGAFTVGDLRTKMEKGSDYGMATSQWSSDNNDDGKILEWNEQAKIFEKHVVGMTVAEVKAMKTKEVNDHNISADDALLNAGCTIDIVAFKDAVVKACNDEQGMTFKTAGEVTLGLGINSFDDGSVAAAADKNGTVKVYSDMAASAVVDGKIVASLNDAIQPTVEFTVAGEIGAKTFKGTKRELKEGYTMSTSQWSSDNDGDGRILEWYLQSAEFSKYVVGMTGAQVKDMPVKNVNDHDISAEDALIGAGCTIQITAIKAVVAESVANAR